MEGGAIEIFTAIFNALDTGALIAFVVLFATGRILPLKVVELILKEAETRTEKHTKEVLDGMEAKIESGFLKALKKQNGEK